MFRLPPFLRQRTRVKDDTQLQALNRLASAYQQTFALSNGEPTPHGAIVLNDLARACMFANEDLPRTADEAMVRAALNAVYSRILRLTSLRGDDVTIIQRKTND